MASQSAVHSVFGMYRVSPHDGAIYRLKSPSWHVPDMKGDLRSSAGLSPPASYAHDREYFLGLPIQEWRQIRRGHEILLGEPSPGDEAEEPRRPVAPELPLGGETGRVNSSDHQLFEVTRDAPRMSGRHSTLVKRDQYEGGLQIWECTWDLIIALLRRKELLGEFNVAGKFVLELGCGHGLPGLWALGEGAAGVVFQDLNEDVIRTATQQNISLFLERNNRMAPEEKEGVENSVWRVLGCSGQRDGSDDRVTKKGEPQAALKETSFSACKMWDPVAQRIQYSWTVSCNWELFPDLLSVAQHESVSFTGHGCGTSSPTISMMKPQGSPRNTTENSSTPPSGFDLILSSECVYREDCFPAMSRILDRCLNPGGIALFAAKRYYFGVGGGSLPFRYFLLNGRVASKLSDTSLPSIDVADGHFKYSANVACSFVDQASNIRDVLLVSKSVC